MCGTNNGSVYMGSACFATCKHGHMSPVCPTLICRPSTSMPCLSSSDSVIGV